MIFHLYKVPKVDKALAETKNTSIEHIVELLRKEHSQRKAILLYGFYSIDYFIEEINNACLKYFDTDFNEIQIDGYLIDNKIQSRNCNGYCDGFAYRNDGYVIVVSSKIEVYSVLCHEICHIILHTVFDDLSKVPIQDIEGYVELIEFFISKNKDWADNIAADKHYSVNVMDNAISYESRSSHVNLAAFIKELEAKR